VVELNKLGLTNPQIGRRLKISRQLAYYLLK
jgi:orotate phosphoribosyltransferase-like protein